VAPGPGATGGPGWGPGWTPRPAAPKPGVIPLRPLGVGEILDGAISTIRAHPRVMLGLSAVVVVASQVLQVALTFTALRDLGQASLALDPAASPDQALGTMLTEVSRAAVGLLLTSAVQGLAMIVLTGMLTVVVSRAVLAERLTAGQAWQLVRPQLPRLLGLTLLTGLVVVLAVTLPLLPAVLAVVAGAPGVVVPLTAVLPTGERNLSFVLRDGGIAPVEVVIGARGDTTLTVLRGLSLGDTVVASATFLLDSESSLAAAMKGIMLNMGMGLDMGGMKMEGDMPGMPGMRDTTRRPERRP